VEDRIVIYLFFLRGFFFFYKFKGGVGWEKEEEGSDSSDEGVRGEDLLLWLLKCGCEYNK